jgi:hypothetical protein
LIALAAIAAWPNATEIWESSAHLHAEADVQRIEF